MLKKPISLWILLSAALFPNLAAACACGCGIFDVGTGAMLATAEGGMVWFEYDFMDQKHNWSGNSSASNDQNADKEIRTHFFTAGVQYMVNRTWGVTAEIPYWERTFKTTDEDGGTVTFHHGALGDARIKGVYSGFSEDMSTGITFGLKLPTGDSTYRNFDRDTEIGTGSTDLLLGAYHMGQITPDDQWKWFAEGQWSHAVTKRSDYRPGDEADAGIGVYYNTISLGSLGKLSPLVQLLGSYRWKDRGDAANPGDSGYSRVLFSPGLEYDVKNLRIYGDVEVPLYQHVNGNQLVAPVLFKFIVGYRF